MFYNSQTQPQKQPHIQKSNLAWGWVRLAQQAFSILVLNLRSCSCKEWIEEVEGGCHCVLDWSLNLGVEVFIEVVLESDASKQRGLCCLNFFWKPISLCKFHSSLPRLKCSLFLSLRSVYFLSLLDMGLYLPRFGFKLHHWDWHALIEFDGVIGC